MTKTGRGDVSDPDIEATVQFPVLMRAAGKFHMCGKEGNRRQKPYNGHVINRSE